MTTENSSQEHDSVWGDEFTANYLRLRVKTFYNTDYFERIVMPLLDIPPDAHVLDVGCGYGGLSFTLAGLRPDLHITGVDPEVSALESATKAAAENGWVNMKFEEGDGHELSYEDNQFEAVLCQTVLTHVRDAEAVVHEMRRVLKPGGVFMAAEYTDMGPPSFYCSVGDEGRDETWIHEYFRLVRLYIQGKDLLKHGNEQVGVRIPVLATKAGLDVFDVRLNDRAMHIIPPFRHPKQVDYLELLKAAFAPDPDGKELGEYIEVLRAAGGTEEEARWLYEAEDHEALREAIEAGSLTRISAYMLFLTFARKPMG